MCPDATIPATVTVSTQAGCRAPSSFSALSSTGGLRAYDLSNPYQPQEVGYIVPGAPAMSRAGAVQLNDIFVDERGIVYTVDRFAGGLYTLERDF